MPFRDPSAESLASLISLTVFKISVNKKFGYENFGSFYLISRLNHCPISFVLNVCVNLGKEHPRRRSKLDQLGLN